jgi:hypothetical protein
MMKALTLDRSFLFEPLSVVAFQPEQAAITETSRLKGFCLASTTIGIAIPKQNDVFTGMLNG